MKTETEAYICYTLTIEKERRYELINFFDEVFFDSDYQIISDTVDEDINREYGAMYQDVVMRLDDFSLRFYVEPEQQQSTTTKLEKLPKGIFVEIENIAFSAEAVMSGYKERFMLTDACEIIFDEIDLIQKQQPIQIILQPKNVFGTGSHTSTKLAAQLLEQYTNASDCLIDVGTGTGILAIYAAKRGMRRVLAVDADPLSVAEAKANIKKNGLSDEIQVTRNNFLTDIDIADFSVIIANLSLHLYKQFLPEIIPQLSSLQTLLFSGVIEAERAAFEALLTDKNLTIKDKIIESGWVAYYVQRGK